MLSLLSFHAIAAQRGDGLRPELLAAFKRSASTTLDRAVSELATNQGASEETVSLSQSIRDVPPREKNTR